MKKTVTSLMRCCAIAGVLLGGVTASEASSITLTNGASSVDLCLPGGVGCGPYGLTNWVANGTLMTGFQQWFTGWISSDPSGAIAWSGPLDTLDTTPTVSSTPTTATVSFWDAIQKVGITIAYTLADQGGNSHILETASIQNTSSYYLYAGLTDGMQLDATGYIHHPADDILGTVDYTPNPEPMTMVLLGTGLVAVARSRRRRTELA